MNKATELPASAPARRWPQPWRALASPPGIQRRILAPLALLMLLSLLGSAVGFTLSTTTTRNRILDEQLLADARRVGDAWQRRERDLADSALLLADDSDLRAALLNDRLQPGGQAVLDLDRRVLPVRDRFDLDQVLVVTSEGRVSVNMATRSALSRIDTAELARLLGDAPVGAATLVRIGDSWLLGARATVRLQEQEGGAGEILGSVYTVLDVAEESVALRRSLELAAEMQLAADDVIVATLPGLAARPLDEGAQELRYEGTSYRVQGEMLPLGGRPLRLALLGSEEAINAIVATGFQVMLASSLVTLALLLAGGALLARSFTEPIRALAAVANAVAAGDLSRRAHVESADEIGQLGRAFDQATATIAGLIDQQAQTLGELEAILQSIADGVLAIDLDERIVQINPTAARMLGQQPDALLGQQLAGLLRTERPELAVGMGRIVEQLRGELADGDWEASEERVTLGQTVVRLRSTPIVGAGRARRGAVVVLQDITSEVAADQAKSDFIAIASHELRTPLTGIKGHIDLLALLDSSNLRPEQLSSLEAIQRQADSMAQLVNDLLEMARIEQGQAAEESEFVHLARLVERSLDEVRGQAAQRRLTLAAELPPGLPDLWIAPEHGRRILTNLISNAVKYTYDGGRVAVRAAVVPGDAALPGTPIDSPWAGEGGPALAIFVEDNGVGIRAADQARLFTRFFRSRNPRSVHAGGTGLGLTITRSLVLHHGGQIGFHSVEGAGSCFWVRFPIRHEAMGGRTEPLAEGQEETLCVG